MKLKKSIMSLYIRPQKNIPLKRTENEWKNQPVFKGKLWMVFRKPGESDHLKLRRNDGCLETFRQYCISKLSPICCLIVCFILFLLFVVKIFTPLFFQLCRHPVCDHPIWEHAGVQSDQWEAHTVLSQGTTSQTPHRHVHQWDQKGTKHTHTIHLKHSA